MTWVEMLMKAGMALEQCQYDYSADDEPRRGSLLSESDSDMEDARGSTSTAESTELATIDRDSEAIRTTPQRAPRLGELSGSSTMDGSQLEFFDAPDYFLDSTDHGGTVAPTIESNDSITPVNSESFNGSGSSDCRSVECGKSQEEPPNSVDCKVFINNPCSATISDSLHIATESKEITGQLYSITESGNNDHPHRTTDSTEMSDQPHSAAQSENNSDQLHHTTESEEICDEVQTGMALETIHQTHYITDSSDGSERPNNTTEREDICVHSFAESTRVSNQTSSTTKSAETSDQANNVKLTEGILDQHKTTDNKDMHDQVDTNGEPEVMCGQKVDLESEITNNKYNSAEPEPTENSIKIVALEEIYYLPQNTSESDNISGDPHSNTGGEEDRTQLDNNREFENSEQMHTTTESKETSCQQITAQNTTTREAEEASGQMNTSTKCKEVIAQLHDVTKPEVRDELCNTTKCEMTKDFTQITVESQEISAHATELAQINHQPHHTTKPEDFCGQPLCVLEPDGVSDQVQSSTAESQASDTLHSTTKSEDTVDLSDSTTEAAQSADQSSSSPGSSNSSSQTLKAKEDCDRPQDSMEVTDHSNTIHLSTASTQHNDQLNSTYPIASPSDLSSAIKSTNFNEVPDKSELEDSIRGPPSNVQNSKMEADCQSDGFTSQSLDSQPKNVNMEFCTILPTCINSQEDTGRERREPIASDMIHPLDIVFSDIHIVNEEDSEPCYSERGLQASEDPPIDDTSHESIQTVPSESPKESHQSDTSLETNDGSSGNCAFPETQSEPHNATEVSGTCQGIPTDQDHESVIEVEHFVTGETTPFLEVTHLMDSIYQPCSDAEGLQVEGKVVPHKDPHVTDIYDVDPAGTSMHHGLSSEDMDVEEMFSEWAPLSQSTSDNSVCTDSLKHNSRISVDEESELAVVLPSNSNELLDTCPLNLVPYKLTVDEDQTKQSGGVELETVVQTVDQTQNPASMPQFPSATISSAGIGQTSPNCEMNEEVAKMPESIIEEHESQNRHQRLTSTDSKSHSENLTSSDFGGRLQPDSELVLVEGAALKPDVHEPKFDPSDEATNDEPACNMPGGQQGDRQRGNAECEPKLHRLVHQPSSTEGQQTPFYFTEEWKEVLQPPNQKVYFRLKQEVGIDHALSVDSKEKFTSAPENNSKSGQWFVEPPSQESREDTHETDGAAVGVNPVKINREFMKFLGHMPKFFGEAEDKLGELPSGTNQGLDEFESESCQAIDVTSSTSVGHENQQDSLVLDSSVNLEGKNIALTSKQATPIHFFNPLVELSLEESEAFFKQDVVADLQDNATIFASSETLPENHLNTSLPSHTSIPHTVSVSAHEPCSDTKPRSRSLLVADISSTPDYSPSTENVFHSPQPSPVTVIAGTAENEPESRSSWMPTWKVPDESVMQLLGKKLLSPKLARSGSKIYKTTGGVAGMNKDPQNRHSMPILVSHSQLTDQRAPEVSESQELSRTPTKIPKSFHAVRAPAQSKAMFRHVALPEVSEEAPRFDQEDPHQVGENKSDDEPRDEDMDWTTTDPVLLRDKNFANQTGNIMRRRSKLIDSSRLLYQEYSDVALNQAIERQKRTETFLEESEPSSPRLRRKLMSSPDSYLQRLSVSSSASLWQDIPMIRGTSTLLSMTREEQKLQEAKFELIMSEASYLRSLNIAVDHFQHSPELQTLLSNQERQWLFSRLQEVRDVSAEFLFDLEEKFEDNMYTFNVCDVVLSHTPAIRKVYLPYVTNQSYQDQTFRQLLSGNPRFQQVLEKLESDPVCQRLSLKSFLILPFQRITRLKLLVQNILKRTRLGSREEAQATQAYNLMEKLIKDCNENVQRMRSTEELIYLSQKIEFECKIFPLISQSRRLVKQGELTELEYGSPLSFKWKVITRPVYLHLFNDCLLLSRRREGSRFVVFDHARASKVRGEKCEIKLHGTNKNIFRLTLQENNQGRRVEFLLRTDTQSEKLRWISALAPPRKKPDLMECHDNPQVQCLKSYKARENDELSLEKADIIMVTQQSKEGWIEGIRLSDGEHGWFPVENVEDISNRHVRLRNLKEEHRVQCARAKLMPLSHR